jgi:polar amino acid transport system ATP-binding protein
VFPGSTSTAPAAQGFLGQTLPEELPEVAGALVVAEFGTVDFATILEALRADNWLHARGGGRASPLWDEIKRSMHAAFVGEDVEWQAAVVDRAAAIVRRALAEVPRS